MYENNLANRHRSALPLGLVALLGASLAGCMSTAEQRQANLYEDTGTCDDFGARYGSPEYSQCMLVQQQRRDNKVRDALEQAHLSSEIARNNQKMVDRMREKRCNRNPDRRECK